MPTKCGQCQKQIHHTGESLRCDRCAKAFHPQCCTNSEKELNVFKTKPDEFQWNCDSWVRSDTPKGRETSTSLGEISDLQTPVSSQTALVDSIMSRMDALLHQKLDRIEQKIYSKVSDPLVVLKQDMHPEIVR